MTADAHTNGADAPPRPGMVPEEAPCPATGRTLWTRPEWNTANDHYMLRIGTPDGRIFVARALGRVNLDDTNAYCRRVGAILDEFAAPGRPLYMLEEYSRVGKIETLSRDRFTEFYATEQDRVGALVFTGLHPLIRLYVKLSQRVAAPAYPVVVVDDYAAGLRCCQDLLSKGERRPIPAPEASRAAWEAEYLGTHYTSRVERLAQGLVLIRERGRLEAHDVLPSQEAVERFLLTLPCPEKGFDVIHDRSGWLGQSREAARLRREAERRMLQLFAFRHVVVIDRRTAFGWVRRLARRLHPSLFSARSRDEALELLSGLEGDPAMEALGMGRRRESVTDGLARELLSVIATIPWDRPSQYVNPYSLRHPLRAVVDALLVVKNDFDDLMAERKRREAELVAAREAAEAALTVRSQFLANMSHEIRTPMNGIVGMAELLQASSLPLEQQHQISLLKRSADSLLGLLNDILDYSRLEAGKLEPDVTDFHLPALLEDIHALFAGIASRKRLAFEVSCPSHVPSALRGEAGRLRQVLTNLVGNALKFTQAGSVAVRVSAGEAGAGRVPLQFRVEDTGIGIDKTQQERIFEPFRQVDGSITRRFGGTGLGLAIVRQLVEQMGGSIEVESFPRKGTTFVATLPFSLPDGNEALPERTRSEADLSGRRALLAEDNEVNRAVAAGLLRRLGLSCVHVENGRQALDALREGRYDLVLMDIQMPVMDGIEAIRRLRAGEAGPMAARIPVLALTANALSGDRELCLEAGADAYLAKPVRSGLLRDALAELLQRRRP